MPTELEALVGHLFVVDGRPVSMASPGAVAMAAPRRSARGREADTFFALIALRSDQRQPAAFYEKLAAELSGKYFAVAGSVTAALREAVNAVNADLLAENAHLADPLAVGLACAVLREQELILAVSGPARCFVVRPDGVERLPDDQEYAAGSVGLGGDSQPEVHYYAREMAAGDFLVLADGSLNHVGDATFQQGAASGEINLLIRGLRGAAGQFSTAQVIKFVSPEGEPAHPEEVAPAPQAAPSHSAAEADAPPMPAAESGVGPSAMRAIGRDVALGLARAIAVARDVLERLAPEEDAGRAVPFRLSPTMQVGVAVGVTVLVAVLTTLVYKWRGETSQYAQLIREAQSEIEQARAGGADQAAARPHWETAIALLDEATLIRQPGAEIASLRDEALAAVDSYDHVTRVSPVLLREYDAGAYLEGPVVQGVNLYLLDTTADILYREDLNDSGTSLIGLQPQIITRQGEQVSGQVVSGLIDMVWMEDGGVPQRNVLAVLSRNGLLITYSPSWSVTAQALPGFEAWQDPRAIAVYNRDLYILDAGANEIWRYQAGTDTYGSLPQRFFTDVVPSMADAVDMAIDTNGNVYILHSSGQVTKYFFGREQPFAFEGLPQPVLRPTALHMSLTLFDRSFFLADAGGGRIYTTAINGTFLYNYKDIGNTVFTAISGVWSVDRPPIVYFTAGNRLYFFPRPQ